MVSLRLTIVFFLALHIYKLQRQIEVGAAQHGDHRLQVIDLLGCYTDDVIHDGSLDF